LPDRTATRIAVCHHPVGPLPDPLATVLSDGYRLANPIVVADELASAGVDLVLSGHVHWPYVETYRGITVVGAPSTSSFPPSYLLVHIGPEGTTVSLVPLAGEAGLLEAYEYAIKDENRGKAISEAVSERYLASVLERSPGRTRNDSVSSVS